jgi:hypothetical protein
MLANGWIEDLLLDQGMDFKLGQRVVNDFFFLRVLGLFEPSTCRRPPTKAPAAILIPGTLQRDMTRRDIR